LSSHYPSPSRDDFDDDSGNDRISIDEATRQKIEAVIKDAGQFWLAIVFCFICSAAGFVIIGPWYWIRLRQWHSLAAKYPILLSSRPHYDSMAGRFQRSKAKLQLGMWFGVAAFLFTAVVLASLIWPGK